MPLPYMQSSPKSTVFQLAILSCLHRVLEIDIGRAGKVGDSARKS